MLNNLSSLLFVLSFPAQVLCRPLSSTSHSSAPASCWLFFVCQCCGCWSSVFALAHCLLSPCFLCCSPALLLVGYCIACRCSSALLLLPLASPLLPLLFLNPLLVGCCIIRHCSSAPLPWAASFSLANFAIPCSAIGWLLHHAPQLLNFASMCTLLPLCYLLPSPLHHWLFVVSRTAAPPLLLWLSVPLLPLLFSTPLLVGCSIPCRCSSS
jgi:hypothetical protein